MQLWTVQMKASPLLIASTSAARSGPSQRDTTAGPAWASGARACASFDKVALTQRSIEALPPVDALASALDDDATIAARNAA
jgi:hypothetical protein